MNNLALPRAVAMMKGHPTATSFLILSVTGAALATGATKLIDKILRNAFDKLIHPKRRELGYTPEEYGLNAKEVIINHLDKNDRIKKIQQLNGWLFKAEDNGYSSPTDRKPLIIFSHGYGYERTNCHPYSMLLIQIALSQGFDVLVYDFAGHGKENGRNTSMDGDVTLGINEVEQNISVIKAAKELNYTHIGLMGVSMGASTSLIAAARVSEVKAVVADSPFTDLPSLLDDYIKTNFPHLPSEWVKKKLIEYFHEKGYDPQKVRPIDAMFTLKQKGCPVKLFHTKGDQITPHHHSERLADAYKDRNILTLTDPPSFTFNPYGRSHVTSIESSEIHYMNEVTDFFSKHLLQTPYKAPEPAKPKPAKHPVQQRLQVIGERWGGDPNGLIVIQSKFPER